MLDVSDCHDHWRVLKIGDPGGTETYVEQWRRRFPNFKALPVKTQESVSILSMCRDTEFIPEIGQKVNSHTFWLDDKPELLAEYEEEKKNDPNAP